MADISFNSYLLFGITSGILSTVAYLYLIYRSAKDTKPNPASWAIWSINDSLILFSQFALGIRYTLFVPLSYAILSWICLYQSMNKSIKFKKLEIICLLLSCSAWIVWLFFQASFLALILAVFVNTIGAIPTIWQNFKKETSEPAKAWVLFSIAAILNLFAIQEYSIKEIIFPLNSTICNICIAASIILNSKAKKN